MKKNSIASLAGAGISALGISVDSLFKKQAPSTFSGSHESDLYIRLQNVANRAKTKGSRKQTGKHWSIAMQRKKNERLLKHQFKGTVDETGRHSHFLQDGTLLERVS